jgi:hypothetical protein
MAPHDSNAAPSIAFPFQLPLNVISLLSGIRGFERLHLMAIRATFNVTQLSRLETA